MAGYGTRVRRDIDRWVANDLVDAATARRLVADVEANSQARFSFGSVLALMAGALFAAAVLIFIAANWEEIPRLGRAGLLFALILGGYVGGAFLKLRGQDAFGESAWLVAAAAFGASIALIGQMYHLSGDEKQAILLWCTGTTLAAGALRSGPLTVGAVLLAGAWMLFHGVERWSAYDLPNVYPVLALGLYALSFWTASRASRVLLVLSMFAFAFIMYFQREATEVAVGLAAASIALFALSQVRRSEAERYLGLGTEMAVLGLIGFLVAVGLLQFRLIDEPEFVYPSIAAFIGIVAALMVGGARDLHLRRLAYAAFIFQIGFIYVVMLGSMMGTAGFFVFGGAVLSLLAIVITRLEKRFAMREHVGGGVS